MFKKFVVKDIIDEFYTAFGAYSKGGHGEAYRKAFLDKEYGDERVVNKNKVIRNRDDISKSDLENGCEISFFLEDDDFYYFLPRFVEVLLTSGDVLLESFEDVLYSLSCRNIEGLEKEQRNAINSFVEYVGTTNEFSDVDESLIVSLRQRALRNK